MSTALLPANRPESIDDLDRRIVNLAARINAVSHDLLVLVRRFDERGGWLKWGFASCAEWLAWRCDLGMNAAREKVRVACALKTLPAIGVAFAKGALSFSKVRSLTRVANRDNEEALLEFALGTTAARVDERCREMRLGSDDSTPDALAAHARRALSVRRNPARGTMTFTVKLPVETGELLDKALDVARDDDAHVDPERADTSWSALQADALVAIARSFLAGDGEGRGSASDGYRVMIHVDHAALRDGSGRAGLPVETARRLSCDADRVVIIKDDNGDPLDVGRRTRAIPTALRRALWARDRGCRYPGCRKRRFVDAHHVRHWANFGATCLDNTLLLCDHHHRLVHEGGYTIEKDYRDRWFFRRPDGRAVPETGYCAADMVDDDADLDLTGMVNNPPAGGLAGALAGSVGEPPPPTYAVPATGRQNIVPISKYARKLTTPTTPAYGNCVFT